MESILPSSQRRHTTYFDEEGEEILRSKRSSVTVEWSDGSKVIFIRPSRPRSGLSWVSQSGPPSPPPAPAPGPAPGPNPQESGTSQPGQGHPNQPASGNTSRSSSSTYGGRRTPRQSHRSNEGSSHRHSQHTPSPRTDPNHPPNHHENPEEYFGAPTDETKRHSTGAVVGIHPMTQGPGHPQTQTQVHGEQIRPELRQTDATQGRTTILHVEANMRGGSGRPSRRSRAGERPDRSIDGSDARDETDYHRHGSGHVLSGLRRYFTFSCWLFGESRDNHAYDRSRSRSRSRRTRGY